jgi:GNAT superfamily N-acetyltransferase
MQLVRTRQLTPAQQQSAINLWNSEYPKRLNYATLKELDAYLDGLKDLQHMFLEQESGQIAGWCFTFERDQERWFAVIVSSALQGQGLGTRLLSLLKEEHAELNGWVIDHAHDKKANGAAYRSPLPFYLRQGFITQPGARLENEKLSAIKIRWVKS